MKCPRCSAGLQTVEYESVVVETCPACGGEWLDRGEMKRIVNTYEKLFPREMIESLDGINQAIFTIDESPANQLSCPKCPEVELNRFNYAGTSGVALDKCPECGGIWLDKDEIEQVQILVEAWQMKLEEDRARFGPVLERIETDAHVRDLSSYRPSRFGFVNAVLRGVVKHFT